MIHLFRRLFRRRDPHSLAVLAYRGAGKGQRRQAYRALRRITHEALRAHVGRL